MGVVIEEGTNALEIRLEPGVILAGKVLGSDGKVVEGARVVVGGLQTSDWSGVACSGLSMDLVWNWVQECPQAAATTPGDAGASPAAS